MKYESNQNASLNMEQFLQELDKLYTDGKATEMEAFLLEGIRQAQEENQPAAEFFMRNELMGYYRVVSRYEDCIRCAVETQELADKMGLQGTVHYGTMLLNIATGYRAAGKYEMSEQYYLQTREIFEKVLPDMDYRMASLHNNISLLYSEIGRLDEAKQELLQALDIIKTLENSGFEVAITYTNLGNLCFKMKEHAQGRLYMEQAAELFEQGEGENDPHYASVLAGLAESYFHGGDLEKALYYYEKSLLILERNYGRNEAYRITADNRDVVLDLLRRREAFQKKKGLELSRLYYEQAGKPMLKKRYPDYMERIAVGLAGEGSECLGYDDVYSTDHDYGPGFCVWLTKEDFEKVGEQMQKDYDALPDTFMGYPARNVTKHGQRRVGIFSIDDFYRRIIGRERAPENVEEWLELSDELLRTVTNGEIFEDPMGEFTAVRESFLCRPKEAEIRKLCEWLAVAGQAGQYNFPRMLQRGDIGSAYLCRSRFVDAVIAIGYLLNQRYRPFYKWQMRDMEHFTVLKELPGELVKLQETPLGDGKDKEMPEEAEISPILENQRKMTAENEQVENQMEEICRLIVTELQRQGLSGCQDTFLEKQKDEVWKKWKERAEEDMSAPGSGKKCISQREKETTQRGDAISMCREKDQETGMEEKKQTLADAVVRLEWKQFQYVQNEGGRASCQDNPETFSIMRKSQFLAWDIDVLVSYANDLMEAEKNNWNLLTEKYARMMASTAPEEYEKLKDQLPVRSPERVDMQERIIRRLIAWDQAFQEKYPKLSGQGRSLYTSQDTAWDTSKETYARGELGTYSDTTVALYDEMTERMETQGENLTWKIMEHMVRFYGYQDLEAAESGL